MTKTYGVKEWRDDIKKVLMTAGGDGQSTVFFLTEAQFKDEGFIEDVNTLIISGDLPNLFSGEEKTEILEKMQSVAKDEVSKDDFRLFEIKLYMYPLINMKTVKK